MQRSMSTQMNFLYFAITIILFISFSISVSPSSSSPSTMLSSMACKFNGKTKTTVYEIAFKHNNRKMHNATTFDNKRDTVMK